jgi:hypothetical protein
VSRLIKHLANRTRLHNLTLIQNIDSLDNLPHNGQVMGDEEITKVKF